ncbi:MAG TPA: TetR family transcriptional regulator [Streptosporangiaceae bacterium]
MSVNRGTGTAGSKRAYRSPLREQNARRTRQAIVAAATRPFVQRGYAATSLADIAAAAEVARGTRNAPLTPSGFSTTPLISTHW